MGIWDLIVSVPDHCLSSYFVSITALRRRIMILYMYFIYVFTVFIYIHGRRRRRAYSQLIFFSNSLSTMIDYSHDFPANPHREKVIR